MNRAPVVIFRQAVFCAVVLGLSLALLWIVQQALGLGTPPRGGVLFVGGSAVVAWISGALLGMAIGAAARSRRFSGATIVAFLVGLVWGGFLASAVIPLYLESALEALALEGAGQLFRERRALLNRSTGLRYAFEAARTLVWSGAGRLPVLSLLVWTLLGPAIAAGLEAWRASRR